MAFMQEYNGPTKRFLVPQIVTSGTCELRSRIVEFLLLLYAVVVFLLLLFVKLCVFMMNTYTCDICLIGMNVINSY